MTKRNRFLLALTVLATAAEGDPTSALTTDPSSADSNYASSIYLLLFVHALVILVVLVICVTGVIMFCLTTPTATDDDMAFMAEYIPSQSKAQLDPSRDLSHFRGFAQQLLTPEAVKLKDEDFMSDGIEEDSYVGYVNKERECDSISLLEDGRERKETRIQLENCKELLPSPESRGLFKSPESKWTQSVSLHVLHPDLHGMIEVLRALEESRAGATSGSPIRMSPQLEFDYFRLQDVGQTVGVRG